MRIVLIGDVGWTNLYHLGDEAMTDQALDELRRRGVDEVTVVAGEPDVSARFYGVPAVARTGFRNSLDRSHNDDRLARVLDSARGHTGVLGAGDPALAVIDAVRAADAVLVAGGGNLNSFFPQHIYERAALTGIARVLGKPYALTSQTVGPLVRDDDKVVLTKMLQGATVVGARESATEKLLADLGVPGDKVVRTMDDAYGIVATDVDRRAVEHLMTSPYVIASFAEKASTTVISQDDYHALVARTMDELGEAVDATVLLVPHAGSLVEGATARDQDSNRHIASMAGERVRCAPMLTARQLAALTDGARLVVGTRYHPAIFAARSAVPSISIAPNMYSSVRMRYSARNVGTDDYVLSLPSWQDGVLIEAARELVDDDGVREHLVAVRSRRTAGQARWWDALVESLRTGEPVDADLRQFDDAPAYRSPGTWASANRALLEATERFDEMRMREKWHRDELEKRIARLRRQRSALRDRLEAGTSPAPRPQPGPRHTLGRAVASLRRRARRVSNGASS
ncbi:polysaccharide pyruvyl transferase family protein [Isoptericola jiangsuensis]|uniref:polysaccharide pyruvyl transferase family protein n=1 Tax=Isoptericola jiangsuensis TaxID=548579 RepID=UPI003AAFA493